MKTLIHAIIAAIATTSSAFAASGAEEDNSGVFVWIFLGMCALIVIGQLLPVVMLMLGFAKGAAKERKAEVSKS
ncbi:MAG: hypothetical protein FD174_2698 [Geobacteraceae bacterium]|nr:MAG: hypothetical protein FD174_2698 [Geobacteraceae bacterium]